MKTAKNISILIITKAYIISLLLHQLYISPQGIHYHFQTKSNRQHKLNVSPKCIEFQNGIGCNQFSSLQLMINKTKKSINKEQSKLRPSMMLHRITTQLFKQHSRASSDRHSSEQKHSPSQSFAIASKQKSFKLPIIRQGISGLRKRKNHRKSKKLRIPNPDFHVSQDEKLSLMHSIDKFQSSLKESVIRISSRQKRKTSSPSSSINLIPNRKFSVRSDRSSSFSQKYERQLENIRLARKLLLVKPTEAVDRELLHRQYKEHMVRVKKMSLMSRDCQSKSNIERSARYRYGGL